MIQRFFCGFAAVGMALTALGALPLTEQTQGRYEERRAAVPTEVARHFDAAKSPTLTDDERAAMMFLYAYMSDPDVAGYTPLFFLENVRASLRARVEMPWGQTVPDREFMHFVLPLRVNNEALDMSRPQFFDELRDRVRNLSMADAILEVNHWCHEKVTYRPSDARTSSPLSSVSQAIGRCGEESTFTVAALRAVGIPARQVYTPRWAHTDDNHAWVEAWADGKWYFLGACEPEPVLNLAWFNAPASRGLLMNTNVFGAYDGPEEQLYRNDVLTGINVTANYAPVRPRTVIVRDAAGRPVKDATVNFGVYNYAEFYPVASRRTGADGTAQLTTGLGDIVAWVSDGKKFNLGLIKAADTVPLVLCPDKNGNFEGELQLDITPPPSRPIVTVATDRQKAENSRRLAREDSIRNAYQATFISTDQAAAAAAALELDAEALTKVLTESRGNHKNIIGTLQGMDMRHRRIALALLGAVSEKDRRDIPMDVLTEHVRDFSDSPEDDFVVRYVLNPRVENERLTGYKAQLRSLFTTEQRAAFCDNPALLARWVDTAVTVGTKYNPLNFRMDPISVARMRTASPLSQKIFFVAAARSLGIPARMDLVRGEAQYADGNHRWHDVLRAGSTDSAPVAKGSLQLDFEPQAYLKDPKYYTHFTISRIVDGLPRLQEYDEGATALQLFGSPAEVDAGQYMLVTGQRLADGGVLADVRFFYVQPGRTTRVPLTVREDSTAVSVIGSVNAEDIYHDLATGSDRSILSTTGRGYYVLGLLRNGHEPTVHTLNDIAAVAERFNERQPGEKMLLLFEDGTGADFDAAQYNLPDNVVIGEDPDGAIAREVMASLNLPTADLPVFVIADTFNRIVFVSQGYTIGLGERLLRTLRAIE